MASQVQDFKTKIQTIYEVDIGDFKRRSLSYLNLLEEQLQKPSLKSSFAKIKELIVCNNTTEIDVLRNQILEEIKKLK